MKKPVVIHKCKVEGGKLILFDPKLFSQYLRAYEGKHLNATFRLPSKNRSIDQNSRHWARMTFAADVLGDRTAEELHYDLCSILLVDRTTTPHRFLTSKDLTMVEFSRFEEQSDEILAKEGIVIPELGEGYELG